MSRSDAAAGFTLLEMLVGLALLAMLTTGLSPALRLAGQAWESVGRASEASETMLTTQNFLRETIAGAYPAYFTDTNGRRTLAYAGSPASVALVSPMPIHLGLGGLQILRIGLREHDGQSDLVADWTPLLPNSETLDSSEGAREVVLATGVDHFELHYMGRETLDAPLELFDTWIDRRVLPKLVSIRLTLRDGTAWPDVLARPMVDLGSMVTR
jgi:general secretion pathway protein J